MNKKQFWTRISLYAFIGLIIPIVFLIWRFQLFKKVSTSGIAVGGWGVIVFIIFVVFFSSMLKAIKKGLKRNEDYYLLYDICVYLSIRTRRKK